MVWFTEGGKELLCLCSQFFANQAKYRSQGKPVCLCTSECFYFWSETALPLSLLPSIFQSKEAISLNLKLNYFVISERVNSIEDIAHYTVLSSPKALGKSLSRESVIASYYIFINRNEREWNSIEWWFMMLLFL